MKPEIKEISAEDMMKAMWHGYMTATDPAKRRWYAFRYEFWANVRDSQCVCLGNPHIECSAEHTVK